MIFLLDILLKFVLWFVLISAVVLSVSGSDGFKRRLIHIVFGSLLVAVLVASSGSLRTSDTDEETIIREIIRTAMRSHLTEEMHTELWTYVDKQPEKFARELKAGFSLIPDYNKQTWISASLSAEAQSPIYTEEYRQIFKQALDAGLVSDDTLQQELINAAAAGGSIKDGESDIAITQELITQTISQMDYVNLRIRRLFDREWSNEPFKLSYPLLGIDILSATGFERWTVETETTNGELAVVRGLAHEGANSKIEVWVGPNLPDYSGLSRAEIASSVCDRHWEWTRRDYSNQITNSFADFWRGYASVVDVGNVSNDELSGQERIRCIYLHDSDQIMSMITTVVGVSQPVDAIGYAFEESITLIDKE